MLLGLIADRFSCRFLLRDQTATRRPFKFILFGRRSSSAPFRFRPLDHKQASLFALGVAGLNRAPFISGETFAPVALYLRCKWPLLRLRFAVDPSGLKAAMIDPDINPCGSKVAVSGVSPRLA